ncbi:MAG TPA: hypothetical protein PLC79_06115, partial [Phycisphaerae bacterium]|nr:hypothetical protein [Phycisphaerae bacterium]
GTADSRKPVGDRTREGLSACSVFAFFALFFTLGCQSPGDQMYRLQKQVDSQKARIVELEERLITLQKQIDDQKQQIITLQRIAPDRMAKLEVPVKIELDKLSGGYEEPGRAGDAGVVAYVRPIDADGDVIKAAGSIVMDVFDLANPPERHLVAHCELDVDHTRQAWRGRLWTNHFTVKCPWPPPDRKPPEHRDLTIRVQFTDYLTGKTFLAETLCTIKLPADAAASRP